MEPVLLAFALAMLAWVLVVGDLVRRHRPVWHWYVIGYLVTALVLLACCGAGVVIATGWATVPGFT